jgi:hypothetical protein
MPRGFTAKDERQVLAIKKSCRAGGGSKADCDRIAFATVNKRRRAEGRTLSGSDRLTNSQMLMLDDLDVFGLTDEQQKMISNVGILVGSGVFLASLPDVPVIGGALPIRAFWPGAAILGTSVALRLDAGRAPKFAERTGLTESRRRRFANLGMAASVAAGTGSFFALGVKNPDTKAIAKTILPLSALGFSGSALMHPSLGVKILGGVALLPLFFITAFVSSFAEADAEIPPDFNPTDSDILDIE